MKTFVIGDVHGMYEEMNDLLVQIKPGLSDRVIFLGDLVDKGPRSVDCLEFVHHNGFECLEGNHENAYIRYAKHVAKQKADPAYKIPMRLHGEKKDIWEDLSPELLAWMQSLPRTLEVVPGVVAVHAGFLPHGRPTNESLRVRWVTNDTEKLEPLPSDGDLWNPPPTARWWTERYLGASHVVYGHAARSLEGPYVERAPSGAMTYALDTGCVYGGHLSAAVFEGDDPVPTFVQVKSRGAYAKLRGADE